MCALKYINVDDAIVTKMKPPRWGTKSPKPNHTQPQIHESKSEAPGQGQKASHSTAKIPPCAPHHAPNPNNSTKGSQAKPKSTQSHKTCFFNYNPWWGAMLHFSPPIFPAPRPTPYPTQKACKSKSFKVCAHPHGGFFFRGKSWWLITNPRWVTKFSFFTTTTLALGTTGPASPHPSPGTKTKRTY